VLNRCDQAKHSETCRWEQACWIIEPLKNQIQELTKGFADMKRTLENTSASLVRRDVLLNRKIQNGHIIVSGNRYQLFIWDINRDEIIDVFDHPGGLVKETDDRWRARSDLNFLHAVIQLKDGTIASCCFDSVAVFNLYSGECVKTLRVILQQFLQLRN
jgi:hypothetical protein